MTDHHTDHKGHHKVLWWIMGILASSVVIAGSGVVGSFATRLNNIESEVNRRGERLRTLEVKMDEQEKYTLSRNADLRARLMRIETKVDDINVKVNKLP